MSDQKAGPEQGLRSPRLWRNGPDARKERVKLIANGLNAVGVTLLAGCLIAPFIDPSRAIGAARLTAGVVIAAALIVAALVVLGYIDREEA